ncbi:dienelactone hydrolase family protein [Acinetobacter baumannii]|nr:dienelactone hydrolase family protein [Acinetobacter baumannii]
MNISEFEVIYEQNKCLTLKRLSLGETQSGILLLPEIWGLNKHIYEVAEQYLVLGYEVFIPDIYWRQQQNVCLDYDEESTKIARKLYANLDFNLTAEDLNQVIDFIFKLDKNYKLGVLGFCMGGTLTYLLHHKKIAAIVSYYGSKVRECLKQIEIINCPALFHLADNDHLITLNEIQELELLSLKNNKFKIYRYPLAGHGFNCPYRPNFSAAQARLAFERSSNFFIQHLS